MNEGVWKSFGLASTSSVTGLRELRSQTFGLCSATGEENNFLFPSLKGGKLERKIFAPTLKGEIFLNCNGRKIVYS